MGAHCSIHNDTEDETVMVLVGVNTKIVQPLLWGIGGAATLLSGGVAVGSLSPMITWEVGTGCLGGWAAATTATATTTSISIPVSALTSAAGGLVSATNFALDRYQTNLVQDLTRGGYRTLLPGQTYTTPAVTPGLNLRAWLVRIQRTSSSIIIKRASGSVWSRVGGTGTVYRVLDKTVFRTWTKHYGSIPMMPRANDTNHGSRSSSSNGEEDKVGAVKMVHSMSSDEEEDEKESIKEQRKWCSRSNNEDEDEEDEVWEDAKESHGTILNIFDAQPKERLRRNLIRGTQHHQLLLLNHDRDSQECHNESTNYGDDAENNDNANKPLSESVIRVTEPEDENDEDTFTILDSGMTQCQWKSLQEDAKEQHLVGDATEAWIQIN